MNETENVGNGPAPPTPEEIVEMTLEQLREFRTKTLTTEWSRAKEDADPETRSQAAKATIKVQHAILALENAELATIRENLAQNEDDLREGTESLKTALAGIESFKDTVSAVTTVLGVVGRIVAFV